MTPDEFYCYGCCGDSRICNCVPFSQAGDDMEYWNDIALAHDDELMFYDNAKMQEHINQVEAGRHSNQIIDWESE